MTMPDKDLQVIQHILRYCHQINTVKKAFSLTQETFAESFILQNAVCMSLLQIGELAKRLSTDFVADHSEMPWHAMRGMRNIFAHQYEDVDAQEVWSTISVDIPPLTDYCMRILQAADVDCPAPEPIQKNYNGSEI
ncbi:MAG: DUF86 domain-containing protein [Selenomonadaceae bacterium]|nr:DUF86 domain-containing protein [Selenomonadaceae bacterium]